LNDGSCDPQQRFFGKCRGAFRHGPDLACEPEVPQVIEESVANVSEYRETAQIFNVRCFEPDVLQVIERLIEAGGKQERALPGERAHEQLEAGGGLKVVVEV